MVVLWNWFFVSNTWNWPFFEIDFFFQIPEIGGSLILSNAGNRKFFETEFCNKQNRRFFYPENSRIPGTVGYTKIKYPPPHRYEVWTASSTDDFEGRGKWVPDEPGQLILLQAAAHMHYWLYPFFREGEKRRLWFVDADSTLGPTLASGESEIPIFKLWKKIFISGEPGLFALAAKCSKDEYPPQRNSPSNRHESPGTLLETSARSCVTSPHFFYFYLEFTLH